MSEIHHSKAGLFSLHSNRKQKPVPRFIPSFLFLSFLTLSTLVPTLEVQVGLIHWEAVIAAESHLRRSKSCFPSEFASHLLMALALVLASVETRAQEGRKLQSLWGTTLRWVWLTHPRVTEQEQLLPELLANHNNSVRNQLIRLRESCRRTGEYL